LIFDSTGIDWGGPASRAASRPALSGVVLSFATAMAVVIVTGVIVTGVTVSGRTVSRSTFTGSVANGHCAIRPEG
jgi:hypothetical protein